MGGGRDYKPEGALEKINGIKKMKLLMALK